MRSWVLHAGVLVVSRQLEEDHHHHHHHHQKCRWAVPNSFSNETTVSPRRLEEALLGSSSSYDPSVRPSVALEESLEAPPDNVAVRLRVHAFSIDESEQTMWVRGLLRVAWKDWRLAHERAETCTSEHEWVMTDVNETWQPMIYASNVILSRIEMEPAISKLSADGTVEKSSLVDWTLECPMKAKEVPLDEHVCEIALRSHSFQTMHVVIEAGEDPTVDTSSTEVNLIWRLESTNARRTIERDGDKEYSRLELEFQLRRHPGYHLAFSMLPAVLFLLVAYNGFFIAREVAPARVSISVIPVLIMRLLLNNVYAQIETVSYQLYLGQFLNICMWITCGCVFEYSLVQQLLQQEKVAAARRTALRIMGARLSDKAEEDILTEHAGHREFSAAFEHAMSHVDRKPPTQAQSALPSSSTRKIMRGVMMRGYPSKGRAAVIAPQTQRNMVQLVRTHSARMTTAAVTVEVEVKDQEEEEEDEDEDDDSEPYPTVNPVFQEDLALLKKIFDRFDADRSGAIEPKEVSNVLRYYGVYISSAVARATVLNYYFFNHMRIPKTELPSLSFEQFVDFITRYDEYAVGHESKGFTSQPTSLQVDIVGRYAFIPVCFSILCIHYLAWFGFSAP
ncbi:hypothetical protein CTAYLR_001347 [Chrysophaeum taylorii]|uniref:EF-hand domain-containing protein n=1 Tax=Chrysophaeum taylorii TaxID=2483200 RepID=A0AAD7U5K5_9STRA|nr:hypothetical protein CTAYLR_001347 [Chrysophaeum taylorii]